MKILVINCGSSSLKYQLFDMTDESVLCKGLVERIGIEGSKLTHKVGSEKLVVEEAMKDHTAAIKHVFDALVHEKFGVVKSLDEVNAIGHRVLHGGDKLTASTIIDENVKAKVREFIKFGPLHNPANLMGIEACESLVPGKQNVAVFDTAFHQTMPARTFMYAIPYEYYEDYRLRKFGFHGTSHRYVTLRTAELLKTDKKNLNIITVHLGNGSSIAAIKNGECYDTTMGLTPLEGLVMGTRSGDLDPTVMTFLMNEKGYSADEMNQILNKKSGVLGVSGLSSDFRDLEEAAEKGNERAQLALDMFITRVRRYVGGFMAELGHVDAISFAGGIGENSASMRKLILENMEEYGIIIDDAKNDTREEAVISADNSRVKVLVVPTNEELMIARDTMNLVK
ncbi:acetate kinase [Parvimonas micra]|jgi:acetate kinase|uniref:Acetate kinase n=1 Tax=Parvimonas micra TaxID=33033 RepID=A0A930H6D0_9FIRM|nr:acetate kinase [Parvimonas micra]MBF1307223.1 acetate kinase [Parvimonas micra]MCK6130424.1 acetate kinase [Parvimonas micra]MCK6136071.1 acetate kinase [Parvimonas micra]MCK6137542.1 acetate kinase [Parvimonas micra]MCK6154070.1 acetate kinase [Parvimonas micra]